MRIVVVLLFFLIFQLSGFADVSQYIEEYTKCCENESYKSFSQIIKGNASISDIEKQYIIDKEISNELGVSFV